MGFVSPWFLAGAAAVALPVWFHLLRRHRSTPMPFSSLMFFEQRTQSSVKHRRLQYFLLLSLRVLLILLLALAFAGPYVAGGPASAAGGRKLAVLAIDNSFSMRQGNRLERAQEQARGVLAALPPSGQAQVLAFAGSVTLMSEPASDRVALRAAVDSIRPGDSRSSLGELVRALRSIAQSSRLALEVHLFSDLQKTSLPAGFAELGLPPGAVLKLHPLADSRIPNWAVESVAAPKRLVDEKAARAQATVAGYGTEAATLKVSLVVNGKTLETKPAEVPAGGRATVEFETLSALHGFNRGEVRIEARDSFPADDRFLFSVERAEPSRVLFVHEARDARSPLYFRAALEAASQAAFAMDAAQPARLEAIPAPRPAFVVLSNVGSLSRSFEDDLRRYVREGGSLLVALGPASAARGRVPLTGDAIAGSRYASRQGERFQAAGWLDSGHPSVRRANRWEGVRFYQTFPVEPSGAQVLARLADQSPVLLEKREGAGRVLVFASTFDNVANDFPLHAAFVPFVEQTARYLGGLDENTGSLAVDSYYELRRRADEGGAADVLGPDGRRVLDLSGTSKALGVTLDREGYYEVRRGSGRGELVAVNADRRESDFDLIPAETLSLWQNTGESAPAAGAASGGQAMPHQLWWGFLFAAFLLAMAESLVAGRYLAARKEEA